MKRLTERRQQVYAVRSKATQEQKHVSPTPCTHGVSEERGGLGGSAYSGWHRWCVVFRFCVWVAPKGVVLVNFVIHVRA